LWFVTIIACNHLIEYLAVGALGARTNQALNFFAILENDQGRDALDTKLTGPLGVFVGVDFGDGELALVCLGQIFERLRDGAAGAAPGRPEIDNDGRIRLQNGVFKFGVSYMDRRCHDGNLPLS
jgi:hypothetical protein